MAIISTIIQMPTTQADMIASSVSIFSHFAVSLKTTSVIMSEAWEEVSARKMDLDTSGAMELAAPREKVSFGRSEG